MVLVLISTNYPYGQRSLPSFDAQIPLKSVEVRGEMIDFVGRVKITQTFINNYPRNIEAKYLFNLTEDSTVVGMTMQIGDRVLVSHVEEKTEARATYETAISEKKMTCLLEKSAANGIYTVQVGNILQGQEIKIEIEYLTQLECSDEGEMKFVLPTNISPKYEAAQKSIVDVMDQRNTMGSLSHASHVPFTFKLDLVWKSNNQIKEVKSLTNDISVSGIDDRTVRVVCETAPRNGDFNILVTTDVTPTLYVSQQGADSFLMINHRIKDEVLDIEGGEYIILVDRSGSMGDSFSKWSGSDGRTENNKKKIDYAREATRLFVQSLPAGCSFNVVSFGSSYETLFPSSVEYNDITSQQALKQIAQFQANMGGTELFQCLSDVLSGQRNRNQSNSNQAIDLNKRSWKPNNSSSTSESGPSSTSTKKSTEKIVILMTDGDVGNVDSVVGLIKQYSYNSRVFTIGIGQDVNRFLCEKVAGASNACSEIMVDNPNISMVVAKMLDAATKSYYKHSTLILPQGRRVEIDKPIYPNRFCTFFHKLPTAELTAMMSSVQSASSTEFMMIGLESVDGINQATSRWSLPVVSSASSQLMDSSIIPRLYAADLIRSLEEGNGNHRHTQEIIRVSCEYGIMNERTSFVVVDERENRSIRGAPLQVTVPQVAAGSAPMARAHAASSLMFGSSSFGAPQPSIFASSSFGAPPQPPTFAGFGSSGYGSSTSNLSLNRAQSSRNTWGSSDANLFSLSPTPSQKTAYSSDLFSGFGAPPTSNSFSFAAQPRAYAPPSASPPAQYAYNAPVFMPPCPPASAVIPPPTFDLFDGMDICEEAVINAPSMSEDPFSFVENASNKEASARNITKTASPQKHINASKGLSKEDTLDQLINFKVSDGSFTYNPQSLQLTPWSRADLQRLISEQQHYQSGSGWTWSESLMFNVLILKLLKEVGSKKYVMIVRNLEKWLEKQFQPLQLSSSPLPTLLQTIAV